MKSTARALLVGVVAVMAVAVSVAPSEAAKKKRTKGMAPGTYFGQLCTTPSVTAGVGAIMIWGYDNKWYQAAVTPSCLQPWCPVACM
jgi:hypothetical protein